METYGLSTNGLIQTVRHGLPELSWSTLLATLVFSCITTRIITGLQCRHHEQDLSEPRAVRLAPYWIPWIGHGVAFAWNHVSFFARTQKSMNEPVFGIYLRGVKHDVVVSQSMMKTVISSPDAYSTPGLDQALQNVFGDRGLMRSLSNLNQEIRDDPPGMIDREPFVSESLTTTVRLLQYNLPNLITFSRSLVDQAPWERGSHVTMSDNRDESVCEANFVALVRNFVGHLTTTLLMGEAFVESFPGLLDDVWTLDDNFITLFVGTSRWVPLPGVSAAYAARDRLVHIMSIFYRAFTSWDDGIDPGIELRDLDDVSELIKQRMRTFRKLELSAHASGAALLSLYWDIIEHTTKLTFWTILHIFTDPALLQDIRREIAPYVNVSRPSLQETGFSFKEPPKLILDFENLLKSCPLFKACYYETLRLHSASISFRKLTSDLIVSESTEEAAAYSTTEPRTYKIRKGEKVIMPHAVHYSDSRYFSNPDQYDPLRFIVTDSVTGVKCAEARTLSPFAEGLYGPKSNSLTEKEVLAFTAAIVSMWEIEPMAGNGFTVRGHKTSRGAFRPSKDVRVKIRLGV